MSDSTTPASHRPPAHRLALLARGPGDQVEMLLQRLLFVRLDLEGHAGVLQAAVLRTFTTEYAYGIRLKPGSGSPAGNEIHLALKGGNPETVNHILRAEPDPDSLTDRDVDLIRGTELLGWTAQVVPNIPPPLVAHDLDLQLAGLVRRGQRTHDVEGIKEERG
jgi:hypothetical protein